MGGGTANGVWVVALLTDEAKASKQICEVVFLSRGKATVSDLAFDGVVVKDGTATEIPGVVADLNGGVECPSTS